MVTKNKTGQKEEKVKVGKLKVNKETVKDLNPSQAKGIRGGVPKESLFHCISDLCTYTAVTI